MTHRTQTKSLTPTRLPRALWIAVCLVTLVISPAPASAKSVTQTTNGITTTLAWDRDQVHPGEQSNLTVSVQNAGPSDWDPGELRVPPSGSGPFVVKSTPATPASDSVHIYLPHGSGPYGELKPGEQSSLSVTFEFPANFDKFGPYGGSQSGIFYSAPFGQFFAPYIDLVADKTGPAGKKNSLSLTGSGQSSSSKTNFRISVRNKGKKPAKKVLICAPIPPGLAVDHISAPDKSSSAKACAKLKKLKKRAKVNFVFAGDGSALGSLDFTAKAKKYALVSKTISIG